MCDALRCKNHDGRAPCNLGHRRFRSVIIPRIARTANTTEPLHTIDFDTPETDNDATPRGVEK